MVTTTVDSSSNHHTPSGAADTYNFPRKNLPSPWAQVVRGADSEPNHQSPPSSSSSSSLDSVNSSGPAADAVDAAVKPVWKRPSNDAGEIGPVMGAISWPALSESTKPTPKLISDSIDDESLTPPKGPVVSDSPQKQASDNVKPSPAINHGMGNRQRSMKRGGANGNNVGYGPVQNNFSGASPHFPPPPPFPVLQIPPNSFAHGVPGVPVPSPREPYRNKNWDTRPPIGGFIPPMNDNRSPSRRGNAGHHPRGDGSYHNSYGNRRDQDRGGYANTRDTHVNHQRMPPRGLMRPPPPNPASFMGPQPMRPFANPPGFPEFYYFPTLQFEPFGGMPFLTHAPPPAMFYPVAETPLASTIVNQIDYYFSDANLVRDEYLRSNMDEQGWVPISLIASFPRVRSLTSNIKLILESLRASTVVEVQGDKLRRRNEWTK
ncbi:la-related protein 1C [Vigna radiata var. radiata]|uniref:La-related protein 1C n=1 Tax=Vigna radiata var. radiata TaxID=3916 RepID=A0A1S3U7G5_VIGRR|nr:la-related protein 1C [Vigna radiata var. radiata]